MSESPHHPPPSNHSKTSPTTALAQHVAAHALSAHPAAALRQLARSLLSPHYPLPFQNRPHRPPYNPPASPRSPPPNFTASASSVAISTATAPTTAARTVAATPTSSPRPPPSWPTQDIADDHPTAYARGTTATLFMATQATPAPSLVFWFPHSPPLPATQFVVPGNARHDDDELGFGPVNQVHFVSHYVAEPLQVPATRARGRRPPRVHRHPSRHARPVTASPRHDATNTEYNPTTPQTLSQHGVQVPPTRCDLDNIRPQPQKLRSDPDNRDDCDSENATPTIMVAAIRRRMAAAGTAAQHFIKILSCIL
ncbi:hypothetical protein EDB85DRAFT_1888055 [Lactarius pseudohatsudake]|nr:hypothetical protein EDB85DRAFT_1888055 [Lactarius pseudohatsudake]